MQTTHRILIIADDILARAGLAALLEEETDLDIVGQASLSADLPALLELTLPDIALIDLGWQNPGRLDGLNHFDIPIAILLGDERHAHQTFGLISARRAFALLDRQIDPTILASILRLLPEQLIVIDPALSQAILLGTAISPDFESMTPREMQVLQLIAQGLTNKAIASALDITEHTVKFHVNAIMSKLNAQSRTDAVVRATRAGLLLL